MRTAKKATKATRKRAAAVGAAKPGKRRAPASAAPGSVPAYIASLPPEHRTVAKRFDTLVGEVIPGIRRVIKWGMPFYGIEGKGWFVSCGVVRGEIQITFFRGANLRPIPPDGKGQLRARVLSSPGSFDPGLIGSWLRQAAEFPGFGS